MQNVPAVVWAVRKELDIALKQRVNGQQAEIQWITDLEQVVQRAYSTSMSYN
jgi:hypothetical protein